MRPFATSNIPARRCELAGELRRDAPRLAGKLLTRNALQTTTPNRYYRTADLVQAKQFSFPLSNICLVSRQHESRSAPIR